MDPGDWSWCFGQLLWGNGDLAVNQRGVGLARDLVGEPGRARDRRPSSKCSASPTSCPSTTPSCARFCGCSPCLPMCLPDTGTALGP